MKFRNILFCTLIVFGLMLLLVIATMINSYSWPEPATDVEYRLRGLLAPMGLAISIALALATLVFLIFIKWLKQVVIFMRVCLNKSLK